MVAVFAGCGFQPSPASGDAPGSDAAGSGSDTDQDMDGVADAVDNCPTTANADQRNRDHDAWGDACDLCPHLATATDPDLDGDKVGDSCDPRQGVTDHLALFNGFYDPASISGWTASSGMWSLYGNALHQDAPNPGDRLFASPAAFQRVAVTTSFVVGTASPNRAIGFCTGYIMGVQQYCCTVQDGSSGPEVVSTWIYPGMAAQAKSPWTGTFAPDDRIQLAQNPANGNQCSASQGTTTVSATGSVGPSTVGKLEFYTASTTASYDYVFIVELD